jgi:hypothetical protein
LDTAGSGSWFDVLTVSRSKSNTLPQYVFLLPFLRDSVNRNIYWMT